MRRDTPPGLLLIDSEPAQAGLIAALAQRAGWRVLRAPDVAAADALARAGDHRLDAALIDLWSVDDDAIRSIALLKTCFANLPIVVVTAQDSVELAVRAIRAGARDVVIKPIAGHRLLAALDNAVLKHGRIGELRPLAEKWTGATGGGEIVGSAPGFRKAVDASLITAATPATILIEGEGGVGKELLARAIHHASPCRDAPFVSVGCGTMSANLAESELFGHERGAFAGAFDKRLGLFARADGGTLFLDEAGALPADIQAKLLQVLQTGEIRPIGAACARRVSVRLIAANKRALSEEVARGRFRADLFHQLGAVPVVLPPLRDRPGDVGPLARHLLGRIAREIGVGDLAIDDAAIALLAAYGWPGNVRQLHNVLFRAAIFARHGRLTASDFPQVARAQAQALAPANDDKPVRTTPSPQIRSVAMFGPDGHVRPMDAIEADLIRLAIGHYRGRMTEVARRLQIGRSTLYRKLGELGIEHAG